MGWWLACSSSNRREVRANTRSLPLSTVDRAFSSALAYIRCSPSNIELSCSNGGVLVLRSVMSRIRIRRCCLLSRSCIRCSLMTSCPFLLPDLLFYYFIRVFLILYESFSLLTVTLARLNLLVLRPVWVYFSLDTLQNLLINIIIYLISYRIKLKFIISDNSSEIFINSISADIMELWSSFK